jgi:hypothetical protein
VLNEDSALALPRWIVRRWLPFVVAGWDGNRREGWSWGIYELGRRHFTEDLFHP